MAWLPLLLTVLAHGTGSLVQAALTQPPSLSANPGQTIQITCSGEDSNYYGWYQQKAPGTGPVTVIYGSKGPSGIPLRFSGSLPSSTGTLTITGVQAEDEAVYYRGAPHGSADQHAGALQGGRAWVLWVHCCCLWCTGGSNAGIFGAGTLLTVLGQPKVSPTVYLFPPSSEELEKGKATVVCLIGDFYPGAVQVTWVADGRTISSGVETSQPQRQSNNQYMASSYLSLTSSEWKSHETYSCKVTHEAGNVEKTLKRSECS
ncbi:immunoglobulin lambda-1 light chain isoform X5 [Falco peregrinus]|uniref:immunoglobulin lambda-1 light chain isoform X5 n=1 Tax=Falco peregrinus TaxID=8954 RepID=UPI002479AC6C|nr:immunoglobulin lambda-1 light chain isoform X5 [Falco peregrinus]